MAINKYGDKGIKWVSHGMLRIEVSVMKKLFEHPINKMIEVGLLFYIFLVTLQVDQAGSHIFLIFSTV